MGIKVTINKKEVPEKSEYPCLKRSKDGVIVYFNAPREGLVVQGIGELYNKPGTYLTVWYEDNFTPFNGTVTLEND